MLALLRRLRPLAVATAIIMSTFVPAHAQPEHIVIPPGSTATPTPVTQFRPIPENPHASETPDLHRLPVGTAVYFNVIGVFTDQGDLFPLRPEFYTIAIQPPQENTGVYLPVLGYPGGQIKFVLEDDDSMEAFIYSELGRALDRWNISHFVILRFRQGQPSTETYRITT